MGIIEVLAQMAVLIACGFIWRRLPQRSLSPKAVRGVLTELVYYLLLPALVLDVLWSADLGWAAGDIALVAASGVLLSLFLAWIVYYRLVPTPRSTRGALILAAGFPNVIYFGLPVLQSALGDWARIVAVQYDLFACTPLVLTLGVYIARVHGEEGKSVFLGSELIKVPPLWAAALGVSFNLSGVGEPSWVSGLLNMLAAGVVPLMLISLGMGLEWPHVPWRNLPSLLPVPLIQLVLMPYWAWVVTDWLSFEPSQRMAVVLEAAMPSMVLGVVLCDRFRLNTPLYATLATFSTVLSLGTLPLWYRYLGGSS
jgi:malate permease and related proteins